ncbi:MAG: dTDP-4-dehydrorhamnose 3,5-epimerase family protein [Planctomycetota bacterium]|nr:dTDP-4-dehydrorhamnose 3,5-epimerase family protein [Planctomycetota bacterium]
MKLLNPRSWAQDVPAAHAAARSGNEPIFVPATIYADDRGWSIMNQYQGVLGPDGQINYSVMYPGVVKAWHRHKHQSDLWMCVRGHLKVGVHRDTDGATWSIVLGEQRPGILIIPETLWHGASTVSHEPAGLLYYVTRAFNAREPDEERRAFDSIVGFPWGVQHR